MRYPWFIPTRHAAGLCRPVGRAPFTALLALCALLLSPTWAVAQSPVIDSADVPNPLDTVYQMVLDPNRFDTAQTAPGQWDFSNLSITGIDTAFWRQATGTWADSAGPNADRFAYYAALYTVGLLMPVPDEGLRNTAMDVRDTGLYALGNGIDTIWQAHPLLPNDTTKLRTHYAPIEPAERVLPFPLDTTRGVLDSGRYVQRMYGVRKYPDPNGGFREIPFMYVQRYRTTITNTGLRGVMRLPGMGAFSTDTAMLIRVDIDHHDSVRSCHFCNPGFNWRDTTTYPTIWYTNRTQQTRYLWLMPNNWTVLSLVKDASSGSSLYGYYTAISNASNPFTPPLPEIAFDTDTIDFRENQGQVSVRVNLSWPDNGRLNGFNYAFDTAGLGATAAYPVIDYLANNGASAFNPGQQRVDLPLQLIDDTVKGEPIRYLYVRLFNASNNNIGNPDTLVVRILDDDIPELAFNAVDTIVFESVDTARIRLELAPQTLNTVRVQVSTRSRTARPRNGGPSGDYDSAGAVLTFIPNALQATLPVKVVDNPLVQGPRTFLVEMDTILTPEYANRGARDSILVAIVDDENTVQFDRLDVDTTEAAGNIRLNVNLATIYPEQVQVRVRTVDGTAQGSFTPDSLDYTSLDDTLTFLPGQGTQVVDVRVTNDTLANNPRLRSFYVVLSNPSPASVTLGVQDTVLVTLFDNEPTSRPQTLDQAGWALYPNPTQGQLTLRLAPGEQLRTLRLYDYAGRRLSLPFAPEHLDLTGQLRLDVSRLPAGAYLLHLQSGQRVVEARFLKR